MLFKKKNNDFAELVKINNLPILILDETFNSAFKDNKTNKMIAIEKELRELIKEQGSLNSKSSELIKTKKNTLSQILNLSAELETDNSNAAVKKMTQNQNLVESINSDLEQIKDRLDKLPSLIDEKNYELFSEAIKISYNNVSKLSLKIKKIEPEIYKLREKLKEKTDEKNLLDEEYKDKSFFLRNFIGHEGIQILDDNYNGVIK